MSYVKWMDEIKWGWRLFFAFPLLNGIFFSLYRFCVGGWKNILLGIIWIPFGALIGWFPDMMRIACGRTVFTFEKSEQRNSIRNIRKGRR